MRTSIAGGFLGAAVLLLASSASADPPPLKVIKLQPKSEAPATQPSPVQRYLVRIADDRTDTMSDQQDFNSIVEMNDSAVPVLGAVLRDPNKPFDQRWIAARALGKIGGPEALGHLKYTLENDKFSMARVAAISALNDLGDRSVRESVEKALEDDAMIVRSHAADALTRLGDHRSLPSLWKALDREDNYYKGHSLWVRKHIVATIGNLQSKKAVPRLVELLDDEDLRVGLEAINGLEKVTRFSFRVPVTKADAREYTKAVAPKWKQWWEENKSDYL